MKKVKRVIVAATAIICECFSPIAVKASIDDVNTFLQQYENDDNAFYTEESVSYTHLTLPTILRV